MAIGASSSCFYPMETKESLEEIGKLDIHTAEIFFNADSELSKNYLKELMIMKSLLRKDLIYICKMLKVY